MLGRGRCWGGAAAGGPGCGCWGAGGLREAAGGRTPAPPLASPLLLETHCTLHTAHFTLHSAHCTPHPDPTGVPNPLSPLPPKPKPLPHSLQALVPREPSVLFTLGRVHKRLGDPDAALAALNTALDLAPTSADAAAIKGAIDRLHTPDDAEDEGM